MHKCPTDSGFTAHTLLLSRWPTLNDEGGPGCNRNRLLVPTASKDRKDNTHHARKAQF